MKRTTWLVLSATGLALWLPACAQKSDIEAVQASQKEILAKLDKLAEGVAKIQAPAQAAQRPQADPAKVWEIPVANSMVRGPKNAPVTIVEFSDFQ